MSEIPKKRQSRFDDLAKALSSGDEDMYSDLVRNADPMAQKNDLSTMLGQHVRENYDNPLNVFENKKLLENIPVGYEKMPEGIAGKFSRNEGGIYLPHENIEMPNRQMGTRLHELGHADEYLNKGFKSTPINKTNILKKTGAEAAEQAFGKHHLSGFFEKDALRKLLSGGKLGLAALAKTAGPAAALYGMSQGDAFAADPTGMLQTDELGKGSDVIPEDNEGEKQKYNNRFKKIRELMGSN